MILCFIEFKNNYKNLILMVTIAILMTISTLVEVAVESCCECNNTNGKYVGTFTNEV